MDSQTVILVIFIVYFLLIIGMAFYFRKSKNLDDFFLGGRNLGPWVSALSAQASDMSGWLLMGLPGAIYAAGTGNAWIAVGLIIGTACNWIFVAKKLRRYTIITNNAITVPQYLENRFRDSTHGLKITAAIFFTIFFTLYTASFFVSSGVLLTNIFNIQYEHAVITSAIFIVLYTFVGGFLAVSWTDFIQGFMMLLAIVIMPVIAINYIGGFGVVVDSIPTYYFSMVSAPDGGPISFATVASGLAWGLGYFGMPHILTRFMAIRKEKEVIPAAIIGIVWVVIGLGSAVLVGLVGFVFIPGLENPETVFIEMTNQIFLGEATIIAAPIIGALFLCGMFAAIKSTADSQLLVTSSAITGDIYQNFKKNVSDKHLVLVSRISILVVATIAVILSMDPGAGVMVLVAIAWAGLGSAFGPLMLLSLFWKRINTAGAVSGIVTGGLVVIAWVYIPLVSDSYGNMLTLNAATGLFSIIPGFFLSLINIIIVSLSTKKPSEEVVADFKKARIALKD